jgi:serine/threonine protein kinase
MIETLGKINKTFAMSGSRSREFFNKSGQLINIKVPYNNSKSKDLRVMPIHEILMEDHDFSEKEALAIESFLMPMLEFDPKKRISAREALKHPWLWSV